MLWRLQNALVWLELFPTPYGFLLTLLALNVTCRVPSVQHQRIFLVKERPLRAQRVEGKIPCFKWVLSKILALGLRPRAFISLFYLFF